MMSFAIGHPRGPRRRERIQRASALVAIVAAHLLGLFWFVTRPRPVPKPKDSVLEVVLTMVAERERSVPAAEVPKAVTPVPPMPLPAPLHLPASAPNPSPAPAAPAGAEVGCALTRQITAAISSDPDAVAELEALPPSKRTSADAVMLWNGSWQMGDPIALAAPAVQTGTVRRIVEQLVREGAADCSGAPMTGPQLMSIPARGRMITLAVGSGAWRWLDLVEPPASCAEPGSASCASPASDPQAINYLNVKPNVPDRLKLPSQPPVSVARTSAPWEAPR